MFNAFRNRVQADGATLKEATYSTTKRQMVNYILDSPSLTYVFVNMMETLPIPCIASDVRTFYERRFLFLPDLKVSIGDYVTYRDKTYLATNATDDETYPQLIGELCNVEYPIVSEERRIKVGNDNLGRPIYKTESVVVTKPCVMTDKIYSQANNNPIPLPDGAIIVKLPHSEIDHQVPEINAHVTLNDMEYKVSTISYENVIGGKGVLEVQLQRIPTT